MKNSKTVVTAALIQSVEIVLNDITKHRYSTTGIYNAHNAVFGLNETPEACTSCLVNRANKLKQWYLDYALEQAQNGKDVYGKKLAEVAPETPGAKGLNDTNTIAGGLDGANVPRETYTDLAGIYSAYAELDDETPTDEAQSIADILEQNQSEKDSGLTMLFDSEVQLLEDRQSELNASNVDAGTTDFDVTDKDGNVHTVTFADDKLTFVNADGETKNMKPGTYTTVAGDSYAVQPGGKATFKANESIL